MAKVHATTGQACLTMNGLGILYHMRELSAGNQDFSFNYRRVDRLLARIRLCLEIAQSDDVGPIIGHASVRINEGEYTDLTLISAGAKLHAIPPDGFDRRQYSVTMRELSQAVGRAPIEWQTLP